MMVRGRKWGALLALSLGLALSGAASGGVARSWRWALPAGVAPPPVPADNPMSRAKVELGRRLFYDADLSVNGTMACATCHEQRHGFADGNATHPGALDDAGVRNVPGLANVAWLPRLTWADPRLERLEAQAAVPLFGEHPVEMAMAGKQDELVRRLSRNACYRTMFAKAFPASGGVIRYADAARAIGAFERTLISLDSPYDRYRRGQRSALSPQAIGGERIFRTTCASCHAGQDLSDGAFHRIAPPGAAFGADPGLATVTGERVDIGRFRTPTLRNVAVTAPYLHDGSARTLDEAIRAHAGPGMEGIAHLSATDRAALGTFLESMTDVDFLRNPRFSLPEKACGKAL